MVHIRVNRRRIRMRARHFHTLLESADSLAVAVIHRAQDIDDNRSRTVTERLRTHLRGRCELHVGPGSSFVSKRDRSAKFF